MSNRSEYCIVNSIDECLNDLRKGEKRGRANLEHVSYVLKQLFADDTLDNETLDELLSQVDAVSDEFDSIDSACDDLCELVDGADELARTELADSCDTGYNSGYEDGADGVTHDDCIEHYEDMVYEIIDDFMADWCPILSAAKRDEISEKLEDERYDN